MTWRSLVLLCCVLIKSNALFSVNINDPIEVEAGNAESICHGGSLELQGAVLTQLAVTIEWTTIDGNILSGAETLNPIINKAGIYYLNAYGVNGSNTGIDSVEIFQIDYPSINFKTPKEIDCENPMVTLDASNSSNSTDMIVFWETPNGNIIGSSEGFVISVDEAGTYFFTVTDESGECSLTDSITVEGAAIYPDANAGQSMNLTCDKQILTLNGTASLGPEYFYEWETDNGNIISGEETLNPIIDAPGIYFLTVWNDLTDCETTVSVKINEDKEVPIAEAGKDVELSCSIPQIILNGTNSSMGDDFLYEWKTTDGNILFDKNTPTPTVNKGGEYTLTVTDTTNGCFSSDQIIVQENKDAPNIEILPPPNFTCATSFMFLNAENSSQGSQFQYKWTTPDGLILDDETTPNPSIGSGGNYILTITNLINDCVSSDTVFVLADTISPKIEIEIPQLLTCTNSEITIDGSNSEKGPSLIAYWQTTNGNIISGENTYTPIVDSVGEYELTVFNIFTGCFSTSQVIVSQDIILPIAIAGEPFTLNCNLSQSPLQGNVQNAQNAQFEWTTFDGNFISDPNSQNPIINQPGTYSLLVTNADNGCTDTDEVTIEENIFVGFEFENTIPTCNNPFGNLTFGEVEGGEEPFIFSIDNGQNFQAENTFENLEAGAYNLVIQDVNGCEISDQIFISEIIQPVIYLEEGVVLEWGDDYRIVPLFNFDESEIETISWTPSVGLDCTDCLSPTATPSENITYQIQITDKNGCLASNEITLQVVKNLRVFIPNVFSPNGDGINDQFTVFAKPNIINQVKNLTVFDRWGAPVFSKNDFQPNDLTQGWNGKKEGQQMKTGIYVYLAEIEFIDGRKDVFKGDVLLKN